MRDQRVDAYLEKVAPFAQPILTHVRDLMHTASPDIDETVKWGMPFFQLNGIIIGNMAGFKEHCSVDLWGPEMAAVLKADGFGQTEGRATFGRISSLNDLPGDKVLLNYFRQAVGFVLRGERTTSLVRKAKKAVKPAPEVPADLAAALKKNKAAVKVFDAFSPSCKREYVDWIVEAKRAETREKRVTQAVEWMAEGKTRMWKYKDC